MNYTFSNLLGAPYRGGSILLHGDALLCPAGNRVRQVALREAASLTYPFQNPHQVQTLALSPDGSLLLSVDTSGRALLVLRSTRVLLHRFTLKAPVAAAAFSPDGCYIALAVGKLLQVWEAPPKRKMVAPMRLHRTYGGCFDAITSIAWAPNSQWIAVASKDITARLFSLHPVQGFVPPTLTGHRNEVVAVFFASLETQRAVALVGDASPSLYTVSADGALHVYAFTPAAPAGAGADGASDMSESGDDGDGAGGGDEDDSARSSDAHGKPTDPWDFARGAWALAGKHYLSQNHSRLTAASYHGPTGVLVTAFSTGQFLLHQLPAFEHLQTLSVSRERISAVAFNATGEWIALGCATLGQLLVWEWRSETYVLKQQGHYYDVSAVAFSPDGSYLASGADDCKLKVWSVASGHCFVTFAEHRGAITAVAFTPVSNAVVSASLDGTVRAFDLVRYRNFRTFTTPEPVQFVCVAIEASGEVVAAGSRDTFQVFLWNMRTGQLLDAMSGHEGPLSHVAFNPSNAVVASASWDRTVRLWDTYAGSKAAADVLQHSHEVVALAFDPSGRFLATSTLNGEIHFWDAQEGELKATIEARRDLRGGQLSTDRRSAANVASGRAFTSLAYSADGAFVIAAGTSKWVCVYDVAERVLLRRFQLSRNYALDGVLDRVSTRTVTDAGPLDLLDMDDGDEAAVLPPTSAGGAAGADKLPGTTGGATRAVLRCRDLALSPTGAVWAAATTEGILLYSLSTAVVFDPTDLTEDVSVPSAHRLLGQGATLKALLVAVRLNDAALVEHVLFAVAPGDVAGVAAALPAAAVAPVFRVLSGAVGRSPHLQYALAWARALCQHHGATLQAAPRAEVMPAFREMQRGMQDVAKRLGPSVEACLYQLSYLRVVAGLEADRHAANTDAMVEG